MKKSLLTAVLSLLSLYSLAAEFDKYQAAASVHTYLFAAQGISVKCSTAFPELANQISEDLDTWKRNDRTAIQRAETLWREMQIASPRSLQEEKDDDVQLEQLWLGLSKKREGESPSQAKRRCAEYASSRAKGILRQRRPEVFEALEKP